MKGILHIENKDIETIINLENITVIQDSTRKDFPELCLYSVDGKSTTYWYGEAKKVSSLIHYLISAGFPDQIFYLDLTLEPPKQEE